MGFEDAFAKAGITKNSVKNMGKNNHKKKNNSTTPPSKPKKEKVEVKQNNTPNSKIKLKNSGNIKIKATAISPIHIGTGEVYEPTNFVIVDNMLYHFRDEDFFMALSDIDKKAFMNILNENRSDSFARINKFVKSKVEVAKKIAYLKVPTKNGIQKDYDKKVGQIVNLEKKGTNLKKVFNKFEIQRTQRKQLKSNSGYTYVGYITGSSLKGAISTAYQEHIFNTQGEQARLEKFEDKRNIANHIFKNFKLSDSKAIKPSTSIGFAVNKERFEEEDNSSMSTFIEVINKGSILEFDLNYKDLDINSILNSCNSHYLPIFETIFANETNGKDEWINEYLEDKFFDTYSEFELKENQFLIRVGKHSGARAVTIDGKRQIKVKVDKRRNIITDEETTSWLFGEKSNSNSNLLPFGWLLCEVV
jgi:CRISPR-associated protein Csm5